MAFSEDSDPAIREQGKCEYLKEKNSILQEAGNASSYFPQLATRICELEALITQST